ncbi:MAG: ATP-dependent acyl-CoA ligase [Hyphococcus sp.]|nr:MAG: ATP-dependent acyl-CoA ligase [Marinicaulis sp.]
MSGVSVFDLFDETSREYSDKTFLYTPSETAKVYNLDVADYSYGEAAAIVAELKQKYAALKVGAGVRIGLAFENRPAFFLHFLAINALGASIQPLNTAMAAEELRYQLEHSEADLVVADPSLVEQLKSISPCAVVVPDDLDQAAPINKSVVASDDPATREAAILYTSGTTGQPKGCILSNEYFRAIGDIYTNLGGHCVFEPGKERIITPLPVTHMNALACSFMAAMQNGACLVQLDRFHPKTWWNTLRESRASIMHYLGVMPAMLLNAPENSEDEFSEQIKFAFGAGCDPRHHERFEKRFGIKLIEAWAMTETGAGAWITASTEPRHVGTRCFGKAPDGLEWKLIDEEGGDVSGDVPGELLVRRRGDNPRQFFFSEYYKDENATQEAWAGGWFHTGDVVRVDENGYFYFVDRRKNVIRRSGENIAAIEVESVLMRHDGAANCVVVPVPDEIRGDEVAALIVPNGEVGEELARSIFDYAMENLVYFKAPAYIAFVDKIPMTASEKVKRGDAKIIARDLVERGDVFNYGPFKKSKKAG